MGLFHRMPRPRLPADMFGWLEKFGRYEFDIHHSRIDARDLWSRMAPLLAAALPLVDAGIEFKRSRGLPTAMFTGYEMQRLAEIREQAG